MALVMLPCDLPWWDSVKKHLKRMSNTRNTLELIEGMQKIHDICNVSLDPEEDTNDPDIFVGLLNFLDNDLTSEERSNFLNKTLQNLIIRALKLKECKPKNGLHFSLQQQSDSTELEYSFISSLIANAFFSTFPKRSDKSHPTLQNFNFTHFFKHLHQNVQKSKLKSILYYFDWLENNENTQGCLKISRQVMTSKEWLTIEDWLECSLPLCPLQIKHEGKLERAETDSLQICFASSKIGGNVLSDGNTQECINLVTYPELLTVLLNIEALEDNEVLTIERVRHISRIVDPKNRACLEKLEVPQEMTICCIDADDYKKMPIGQYEEDNILRELNKCLLAFQQKQFRNNENVPPLQSSRQRRLSPIGESIGSTQSDPTIPLITQQSCSTNRSASPPSICDNNNVSNKLRVQLEAERNLQKKGQATNETLINNRRGRFIVLGSSGECLPVTRKPMDSPQSIYSSCESSEEEFVSAKTSLDDGSEDENFHKRYSIDLETPERRHTFAQRLRDALRREVSDSFTSSGESSYAVGISVAGSDVQDRQIKVRRGGSTGFALREDSLDENFLQDSLQQERLWIDKFKSKQSALSRKESNKSSEYSFSTEYSSELEEVYEQFSRWLQNPILETDKGTKKELEGRELAVVQFAGSLLKRTLSESFAGVPVPLAESADSSRNPEDYNTNKKSKLVLSAKSLSLELARQKHKLAAQLISEITRKQSNGLKSVSTGNWGCGSSKCGDVQLKVIIQWLAASVAGIPSLRYYTYGHPKLAKLDTVCRILVDRKWTVKDLAQATLRYSNQVLHGREDGGTLFEELIGLERAT
ncbi:uncharacterized protein LOC135122663 isoform X2 [Zophobas morio]|uniref:uncharacterized protein LOC135122663 isoform X2 n=1 Tax=Zophobas morio TaxID=2755281 RepID=UPI00308286F4